MVDRVTEGSAGAALLGDVLTTLAALVAVGLARLDRGLARASCAMTVAGVVVGVALVHLFVRLQLRVSFPWLAERPAQLVNDAVAALATLSLASACARRRIDVPLLLAAAVIVALYAGTHRWWHLDVPPRALDASVQQCVVAQFVSVCLALLVFRWASSNDRETC